MQFKKFILSIGDDGAQEADLNRFLRSHRVLKVEQHFMAADSFWAILVSYLEGDPVSAAPPATRSNTSKTDPEKELTSGQLERYRRYVDIRLKIARREGIKAYHVFTNHELVEMAKKEALSIAQIGSIDGVGEKRAQQYGSEFLEEIPMQNETSGILDGADCLF